ncbi:hypothetical protein CBR_g34635 [Chara braunii]|uniref:Uncharacterized protein n=1 Tax=Chara braunii TaxID=69332 RepID=A0A388LJC1_CHABU|nr:hypothetical protein CBR_g34635 [Chara braunii]|eukprot:GBG82351.1 hypothetical protein CBR_g34635 [Chara braunii]
MDYKKKWDNIFQQPKTVYKFMSESRKEDFFTLTPHERKEKGFEFQINRRVYEDMKAMTWGDHIVHPTSLVDIGAPRGFLPPCASRNESVASKGGGDGQNHENGSTKESSFSTGSGGGGGKRKNLRQLIFEVIGDVMDKHGKLMAATVDNMSKRQCSNLTGHCDILEREVDVQKEHYEKADQANVMICNALLDIVKAIRERS